MSKFANTPRGAGSLAFLMSGLGPQIYLAPQEDGTPTPEEAAAAAAAAEEAARIEAARVEAEKQEAAKAEREATEEAARIEAEKHMSESEREKAQLLREVMEKKSKLKAAEDEKARLAEQLKQFEGIDVGEVKKLLEEKANAEKADLERRGEFERLKTMMREEHEKEKAALQKQIEEIRAEDKQKDNVIDALTVGNDFAASKFIQDDLVLTPTKARGLYGTHFEVVDGKTVGYNKPSGAAERTMLVDSSGNPLSFDAAMQKIIEADPERDTLLKSKVKPGAQSRTSRSATKPGSEEDKGVYGASRIRLALEKESA